MFNPNKTLCLFQYIGGSLLQEDLISKSTSKVISDHYLDTYQKAKVDGTANQIGTFIWVGGAVKNTPPGEVAVNDGWRKALFTYSSSFAYDKQTLADPSPYQDDIRSKCYTNKIADCHILA